MVLLSLLAEATSRFLAGIFLRSAVQAPTGRRRRESRNGGLDFDAAGNLPKIEEAYRDLNDYATPVCAIRFVDVEVEGVNETTIERPGILLAFGRLNNTSINSNDSDGVTNLPQEYAGLRNHVYLSSGSVGRAEENGGGDTASRSSSSQQSVLITGDIGDARVATRMIMQISLNHTFDYDCAASGKYLAESLGSFIQRATMGADNPLKAHVLIASTIQEHAISLHSVDAAGNVAEVMAGVAGRGMTKGMALLEEQYRTNITLAEAKELASRIINISVEGDENYSEKEIREDGDNVEEFVVM